MAKYKEYIKVMLLCTSIIFTPVLAENNPAEQEPGRIERAKEWFSEKWQSAKEEYQLFKKKGFKKYTKDEITSLRNNANQGWQKLKTSWNTRFGTFKDSAKKVEDSWKKANDQRILDRIKKAPETKNINDFLSAVRAGDIDNSLRYLIGAQIDIFKETKDGQNVFTQVLKEAAKTSATQKDKRALLLFVLYKIIERSLVVAQQERDENVQSEYYNMIGAAAQSLSDEISSQKEHEVFKV